MKTFIKIYALSALFLGAITTPISAQTRRNSTTTNKTVKRTSTTTAIKNCT